MDSHSYYDLPPPPPTLLHLLTPFLVFNADASSSRLCGITHIALALCYFCGHIHGIIKHCGPLILFVAVVCCCVGVASA